MHRKDIIELLALSGILVGILIIARIAYVGIGLLIRLIDLLDERRPP